jgi:hypothetical protein
MVGLNLLREVHAMLPTAYDDDRVDLGGGGEQRQKEGARAK